MSMQLIPGVRLAQYEILQPLGAGGMGAVYRARDTRLGRDVAIKVLPEGFSADRGRLERFDREARLLAALNHPHIASIHDFADLDGAKYLVMELAPGETLEATMRRGPIAVGEALAIARQICDALAAAHERGIVHRDLKPANVVVDDEGGVKVLDFGLARADDRDAFEGDPSNSPTIARGTEAGMILGTAAYMSPEQARGKRVDRRADIWAFGVVMWEMLTGKRLFTGETVSDTLAAVLTREVDFDALPPETPAQVIWVLRRCLARDPAVRFRDAGDVRIALDADPLAATVRRESKRPIAAAAVAIFIAILFAMWQIAGGRETARLASPIHAAIPLPKGSGLALSGIQPGPPVLSPDGKRMALVLDEENGSRRLWIRDLASSTAHPLEGTGDASYPFWSPDGEHVAFFADGKIKRVPAAGGSVLVVTNASNGKGGAWNQDDVILFSPLFNSGLHMVPANGGTAVAVTKVDTAAGETSHRFPQFLADGRRFLYLSRRRESGARTMLGSLDGGEAAVVLDSPANALLAGGHLLYLRDRTLLAQPFDEKSGTLTGSPYPLADPLRLIPGAARMVASASDDVILYQTGDIHQTRVQLQWVDRKGEAIASIGEPLDIRSRRISPDGKRIAAQIGTDLWIIDALTGNRERLTFHDGGESSPVWSPDGRRIAYAAYGERNEVKIETVPPSGTPITAAFRNYPEGRLRPTSWSPDGSFLIYEDENLATNRTEIILIDLATGGEPRVIAETATDPGAQFSPDGRWISFDNLNEEGEPTVFVVGYPDLHRRWQVGRGEAPFWNASGTELFFQGIDGSVHSVEVRATPDAFAWGAPVRLFQVYTPPQTFDGERFLVSHDLGERTGEPLLMLLNWRAVAGVARGRRTAK
jgi:eukaryotic-like serine/threonine-protein kinase